MENDEVEIGGKASPLETKQDRTTSQAVKRSLEKQVNPNNVSHVMAERPLIKEEETGEFFPRFNLLNLQIDLAVE